MLDQTAARSNQRAMARYFSEAALLRTCLAYNQDDFLFANPPGNTVPGKIVYIFDANIVAFFLQPERENERRKVLAFRSDGRARSYATATALIAAEYLFSRQLAGQRNNPPLIAPTHGDDLGDILGKITDEIARQREEEVNEGNIERVEADLGRVVAKIQGRSYPSIAAVAEELRAFVPRLADELEDRFAQLQQLDRIYRQDLLRPLALHTAATLDVLQPSRKLVDDWATLIGRERVRQKKPASNTKCRRDAAALVQTMMLDRQAQVTQAADEMTAASTGQPAPDPLRYVLVTADMALYDAYTQWYWTAAAEKRGRFVLRLPVQYVPILNTFEMPNSLHDDQVTRKAFLALDSLFGNLKGLDKNYERKLAYYRIDQTSSREANFNLFGKDPFEIGLEAFEAARDEWNTCYMNGVVLNATLMQRRHAEAFEGLVRALSRTPELREALAREQIESLSRIVGAHAEYVTPKTAHDLLADLRAGKDFGAMSYRVPFLFRLEDCGLPASVVALLTDDGTTPSETLERDVRETIGTAQDARSLLLAAVIAFRKGHWLGARAFARHALSLEAPDVIRYELYYLAAVSTRRMLATVPELEPLLQPLDETRANLSACAHEAEARGDAWAALRAKIEQQALRLTLCRLGLHGPLAVSNELSEIDVAVPVLHDSMALMEVAQGDATQSMLVGGARRIALGAAAQLVIAGERSDFGLMARETLEPIVTRLLDEEADDPAAPPLHVLHRALGRWFLGRSSADVLRTEVTTLLDQTVPSQWLAPLDELEMASTLDLLALVAICPSSDPDDALDVSPAPSAE